MDQSIKLRAVPTLGRQVRLKVNGYLIEPGTTGEVSHYMEGAPYPVYVRIAGKEEGPFDLSELEVVE